MSIYLLEVLLSLVRYFLREEVVFSSGMLFLDVEFLAELLL